MVFWVLHRVFSTFTLLLYLTLLIWIDYEQVVLEALQSQTWVLVLLQACRHSILGMSLGLHRYYSHGAFKAQRWFEFLLTYSCAAANQGGIGWWAANHRHHHRHCDTPEDPHSPVTHSLIYAWIGWTYDSRNARRKIRLKRPEAIWFDKWCFLVPWFEWALVWWLTDSRAFATLVVLLGTFLQTMSTLWFNVRSHGGPPDKRGCTATTYRASSAYFFGEWEHRDHHDHPAKARRPGLDLPYYLVLLPMARLGVVWNLRE